MTERFAAADLTGDSDESRSSVSDIDALALMPDEIDDLGEAEPGPATVTYATYDFDVAGLIKRLTDEEVLIPRFGTDDPEIETAGFQRGFVWTRKQMDRFVESLLLEYPIPSLFLVKQADRKYLVLDGQQRLLTLKAFFEGYLPIRGKDVSETREVFSLSNVSNPFKGLTYETLSDSQKRIFNNTFLTSVVVSSDNSAEAQENIYKIFERLNSGGTQLTAHEIRVALYPGKFIVKLESLNQTSSWRSLFGPPNARLRDQEIILRSIAFYLSASAYKSPLKSFLNEFVGLNRNFESSELREAMELFARASELLASTLGKKALRRESGGGVNAAQTEAFLVALMHKLKVGTVSNIDLENAYRYLMDSPGFASATETGTSALTSVSARLKIATEAFGSS